MKNVLDIDVLTDEVEKMLRTRKGRMFFIVSGLAIFIALIWFAYLAV
jgi:hypothetical protein